MTSRSSARPDGHGVQFYDDERFLHREITRFFAQAERPDEPLVMIARPRTFAPVVEQLASWCHVSSVAAAERVVCLDAHAVLAELMEGSTLDLGRVEAAFADLLGGMRARCPKGTIRIYGEMVDLLTVDGNVATAIQIEEAWNLKFATPDVAVMCGYAMSGFEGEARTPDFEHVCRQHTHIIPARRFADAPVAGAPRIVYIVEDDGRVRRSLQRVLRLAGFEVHTFDSAEAFLADVDRTSGGCVVVDIQLSGMSGSDLQRYMAAARWAMPVIAMSGAQDARFEHDALRLGAHDFLRKPFEAQALIDAIVRVLR